MAAFEAKIHGMEIKGMNQEAAEQSIKLSSKEEAAAELARQEAIERIKSRRVNG